MKNSFDIYPINSTNKIHFSVDLFVALCLFWLQSCNINLSRPCGKETTKPVFKKNLPDLLLLIYISAM